MKTKLILNSLVMVCSIASIIVLSSCGDDSSSSPTNYTSEDASSSSAKKTSVNTIYELGTCSYSNEDETIYVNRENEYYTCSVKNGDHIWVGENSEYSSNSLNNSSSSECLGFLFQTNTGLVCVDADEGDAEKSSSSIARSSSSVETYSNVSDVWTGKMKKPSTTAIDGKTFMLIYTAEEFAYFADQVTNKGNESVNAKLMQHIRLNPDNMVDENGNLLLPQSSLNEWTPIGGGTNTFKFTGTLDGNGYIVSGVYVNKPAFERAGLIGTLGGTSSSDSGHVKFLGIENSYIVGDDQVGGIAGRMNYGEIQQVFNRKSYVKGQSYVGGIVGYKNYGWLYYAYNSGMVVSQDGRAAGIVGYNNNAATSIKVCYNVGFLIAPNSGTAGGITASGSSTDSFYLNQSDRTLEAKSAQEKTESFMTSEQFISTLNGLSFSNIWMMDESGVNEGYPVFTWEKALF